MLSNVAERLFSKAKKVSLDEPDCESLIESIRALISPKSNQSGNPLGSYFRKLLALLGEKRSSFKDVLLQHSSVARSFFSQKVL